MEDSTEAPCVSVGSSQGYSKRSERSKRGLALSRVCYFLNITSNFDREGRSQILSMVLRHPKLQEIVKKIMFQNQTISEAIVENMKTSLHMVKGVESADKLAAKRVALHMVANNAGIQQYNDRRVAKALGIQPRNLKKHHADIQAKTFKRVGEGRKRRADCLSEEVVHSVIQFWTSNTRVSPNKKNVCRQLISQKNYRVHPSHYLELTEVYLHQMLLL
ncbi:hypothetical protein L7F22_006830 [Adiantum nelumboides]|nr:hypothetical protein [Adiantum nelumboides]